MYVDILLFLRAVVRRKHPEKQGTNICFHLHNNAPAHWSVLVKDFLAMNSVTTLEHPPYSFELAPGDFACSLGLNWH